MELSIGEPETDRQTSLRALTGTEAESRPWGRSWGQSSVWEMHGTDSCTGHAGGGTNSPRGRGHPTFSAAPRKSPTPEQLLAL